MKPVYTCDDYEFANSTLTIYNPTLIGTVKDMRQFNQLTKITKYKAIVCPELFQDMIKNNEGGVNKVVFK